MAITRLKNWNSGEVLTASDLNAEFNNIITAGISLISPIGASFDLNGNEIVLDTDGDTTLHADTDDKIDIRIGGADSMAIGHATGNTGAFLNVDPGAFTGTASTDIGRVRIGNTNAVTVPAGTTAVAASLFVEEPNLTATGTITNAATVYIEAAPTEGGSNYGLWVDAGQSRFDERVLFAKGGDIASADPLVIGTDGNYFDVTGTTNFASMTVPDGTFFMLQFDGALTITHGSGIDLPSEANVTTTAGDRMICFAEAADTVQVLAYFKAGADPANALEQGTHTIFVPAAAMRPTVSNGCASLTEVETTAGRPDMVVLDFDASADEHAQFQIAMPKSWDEGTITFQVFWTTTNTGTDGVAWGLQGVACADGDTIDVAYGTAVVVTDAAQTAVEDLYVTSESSAVTIAGSPAAGEMSFFRIFRDVSDAADDMTEDARLIGVKLFVTLDAADDS